ncbi:MAG: hypothetical protein ACOCXP_01565 [Candidatus Dojkabacteria bacterium]
MSRPYPEQRKRFWLILTFVALVVGLSTAVIFFSEMDQGAEETNAVVGYGQSGPSSGNLSVSSSVSTTALNLRVYPDSRVPSTGNFTNTQLVEIRTCNSALNTVTSTPTLATNSSGDGTISFNPGSNFQGLYNIYVRGVSHLGKDLGCVDFNTRTVTAQFTAPEDRLIPGEVSAVYDNYINGLDASGIASNFGTSNVLYDLNRDGIVDQLDLDIWGGNVYLLGDDT